MADKKEERRRFPRVKIRTPIRYQIKGEPEFDNAVSDNISAGGLSFISHGFISPATDLILEIKVLSRFLTAVGKIVWSYHLPHSDRSRSGVEFVEIEPIEKDFLANYLNMIKDHL